jgi:hypothetical protein
MSDPVTNAVDNTPAIVATITGLSSFIFGLPVGVVIAALGGAYWATYRKPYPGIGSLIFQILTGMFIACIFVEGAEWLGKEWFGWNIPQRPLAFILAFAVIDKPFRDKVIDFFWRKAETIEVKQP